MAAGRSTYQIFQIECLFNQVQPVEVVSPKFIFFDLFWDKFVSADEGVFQKYNLLELVI